MAKKTEVRSQKSEEAGAASTGQEACPTYTIHADTRWGMLAMLALNRLVTEWDAPLSLQFEIEQKMREFEFYEESHRGDPAA